jgi:prevent-host-death family protein
MARLTATEASRNFADVLTRVAAGEEIEVTRGGTPVAVIVQPRPRLLSPSRFAEVLESLPPVDDQFAADVMRARRELGPPRSAWPS